MLILWSTKTRVKRLGLALYSFAPLSPEGGTSYNGLYGEAPPERGTFFTLQVHERVGISRVEVYERVGKSVISFH